MKRLCMVKQKTIETLQVWSSTDLQKKDHVRIKWLKDTPKAFVIFRNKQQKCMKWYVKVCIFWKCIQYTIHWDKLQILKQFPSDKTNGTKNALFSVANSNSSVVFIFNLRFFYGLRHKVRLSKTAWDFRFSIPFRIC